MSIAINRYKNLQRADIDNAIKFLQGNITAKDAPSWVKRFKKEDTPMEVRKDKNLYIDGLLLVGNDERDSLMRSLVYDKGSDVPPSRDGGYHVIKSKYLNLSRRNWVDFLKKQRVIRMTDNAPPSAKKGGKKINRPGELELDLFFISKKDIRNFSMYKNQKSTLQSTPVVNIVDRLTSFCWCKKATTKEAPHIATIIKQGVQFFENTLKLKRNQIHLYSDDGAEFKRIKTKLPGIHHQILKVGSKVEMKNSHVQRVFHRIKNAKRGNTIGSVLQQAVDIVNNTYNRILKKTPKEAVEQYTTPEGIKKLKEKYNQHRAKADTDRRKALKVGDFVRIVQKSEKDTTFYKAYRGLTFTKEGFPVGAHNKGHFKGRALSKEAYEIMETRGSNPKQYKILGLYKDPKRGVWFSRHQLSEPLPDKGVPDQKSEALLRGRDQSGRPKGGNGGKKKKKKAAAPPKEDKQSGDGSLFISMDQAVNHLGRVDTRIERMESRGTATKTKFDKAKEDIEKVLKYFTWHSGHGGSMIKKQARKHRDLASELLDALDEVRVVG